MRRTSGGSSSLTRRSSLLFRLRELLDANRDELAAAVTREHGKVLEDARGEVARGIENVEFACGVPNLLKGSSNSEVSTGDRHPHRARAARRRRRHHPVQFPGHGAAVDDGQRRRLRELLRAQAVREGSLGVADPGRDRAARRVPGRGVQRRAGRPGGGRGPAGAPRRGCGLFRRQHARGASHLRDGDPQRQAGPGARRREEPHGRAPRCRSRRRGRCRRVGRIRVGRGAVHGHFGRRRGRAGGRPADRCHRKPDPRRGGRCRRRPGVDDGPADHPGAP